MRDFNSWVSEEKDENLQELSMVDDMINRPMNTGMRRGLDIMGKATDGMEDTSTGQRKIMGTILQQVKQLPPKAQKRLAQAIMQMSRHPIEDQATNPKARYDVTQS